MLLAELALAAAQPFDVEAATRGYMNLISGAARAKSDAYFEGGYWLILWNALIDILVCWLLLRSRWSARFSGWATRMTRMRWLRPALYAVPFTIVSALIALPWVIYTDFLRERQYGLMNQSFGAWLGEQGISLGVQVIVFAILFMIIFAVIRRAPRLWWLFGTGALVLFAGLGAVIAPVFIAPLFNTYTQMSAGPLRDQILAIAHANHIPTENVYVFDASKQTKRISANVSGLGPTIRISLNDNLLNRTSPAEVKAVMGHEMGHYVLGHVWNGLIAISVILFATMILLWWLAPRMIAIFGPRWGIAEVADPAAAPLFLALITVVGLVLTPVTNSLTRMQESEADAFGLDAAREPDGFASTAIKLSEYRKLDPGPIEEVVFFDHPSGHTRVHMAMQWKADHMR